MTGTEFDLKMQDILDNNENVIPQIQQLINSGVTYIRKNKKNHNSVLSHNIDMARVLIKQINKEEEMTLAKETKDITAEDIKGMSRDELVQVIAEYSAEMEVMNEMMNEMEGK